jgi:hypothetical protein
MRLGRPEPRRGAVVCSRRARQRERLLTAGRRPIPQATRVSAAALASLRQRALSRPYDGDMPVIREPEFVAIDLRTYGENEVAERIPHLSPGELQRIYERAGHYLYSKEYATG